MPEHITKVEAACRQLDTAIDLYFHNADSLSVYTLAFASLKVLMNLYPHRIDDGFAAQLDKIIGREGWSVMSGVGNFLKHADRDPNDVLENFHPEMGFAVIGLATLLYRRIAGNFSIKMEAFDCWVEAVGADDLGIPEADKNPARAGMNKHIRDALKQVPRGTRLVYAKEHYLFFLANRDRVEELINQAIEAGKTLQQIFDENLSSMQ